jgi:hypothetical protein
MARAETSMLSDAISPDSSSKTFRKESLAFCDANAISVSMSWYFSGFIARVERECAQFEVRQSDHRYVCCLDQGVIKCDGIDSVDCGGLYFWAMADQLRPLLWDPIKVINGDRENSERFGGKGCKYLAESCKQHEPGVIKSELEMGHLGGVEAWHVILDGGRLMMCASL